MAPICEHVEEWHVHALGVPVYLQEGVPVQMGVALEDQGLCSAVCSRRTVQEALGPCRLMVPVVAVAPSIAQAGVAPGRGNIIVDACCWG